MSEPFYARTLVAERLSVTTSALLRYEARGLVRSVRSGPEIGYEPAEIRRLWTILTLQRDLGVNLAGVEAVLTLRAHVDELHRQLGDLADRMQAALDAEAEAGRAPDAES